MSPAKKQPGFLEGLRSNVPLAALLLSCAGLIWNQSATIVKQGSELASTRTTAEADKASAATLRDQLIVRRDREIDQLQARLARVESKPCP